MYKHILGEAMYTQAAFSYTRQEFHYAYLSTTAVDGFQLILNGDTIASGEFRLYGVIV
jgi:hypothetical protein